MTWVKLSTQLNSQILSLSNSITLVSIFGIFILWRRRFKYSATQLQKSLCFVFLLKVRHYPAKIFLGMILDGSDVSRFLPLDDIASSNLVGGENED